MSCSLHGSACRVYSTYSETVVTSDRVHIVAYTFEQQWVPVYLFYIRRSGLDYPAMVIPSLGIRLIRYSMNKWHTILARCFLSLDKRRDKTEKVGENWMSRLAAYWTGRDQTSSSSLSLSFLFVWSSSISQWTRVDSLYLILFVFFAWYIWQPGGDTGVADGTGPVTKITTKIS